jgi:hypothetical protein
MLLLLKLILINFLLGFGRPKDAVGTLLFSADIDKLSFIHRGTDRS